MRKDTLVLNRNFCPIQIIDWKKCISLIYQNAAQSVDENLQTYDFDDWVQLSALMKEHKNGFVHSPSMRVAIPEVIRLTKYDRLPKQEVKFSRRNIYEHYGNKCCYCGKKFRTNELNLDHVLPRSRGGQTNWNNIVLSCIPCNTKKDCRTPEEAKMKLLVKPGRPRWKGATKAVADQAALPIPVSWSKLIDAKYWSTELEHTDD